jgi:pimeloyl-ACP methyl ester carboxylesterase
MTTTAIFLPGLYGSTLHSARSGALRWPALGEIIWHRRSLATRAANLRAGRVVDRVSIVPGLYHIEVYGEAIAALRSGLGADVAWRELAYDWRSEVSAQAAQLDATVDAERARGQRVALIGHSLGGLLACYYLRYGAQPIDDARETWAGAAKIERVALAGVPFGGSALALVDLVDGRRVLGNGRLLDASAYRSFGATWQLLPASADSIIDADGKAENLDLFDAREWERLQLIPAEADTATHLRRAQRLRELLAQTAAALPTRRVPMLLVQGSGRTTLERVVLNPRGGRNRLIDNARAWQHVNATADKDRLFGDGDGVVAIEASAAPAPWHAAMALETLQIRRGHRRLLHDRTVQQRIAQLLQSS